VRRVFVPVVSVVLVLGLAGPALATHTNLTDDDDTRGLLDLSAVVSRHESGPYEWVFKTYVRWTVKKIWDRGYFVIQLDTKGDEGIDYIVVLRSDGRQMIGDLFRKRANGDEVYLRTLPAGRAGSKGAGVDVPRRALKYGASRTSFFWTTLSAFTGTRCRVTCIDLAPDDGGMVEQELPTPAT